jgi:CDP-paratose 2-epimerase
LTGKPVDHVYDERNREGDHICYISDLKKLKSHFPGWTVTRSLDSIVEEMVEGEMESRQ